MDRITPNPVKVIAEIGISHEGNILIAKEMIRKVADAGADIAKFQSYRPLEILGHDSPHLKEAVKAQFSAGALVDLAYQCEDVGIEFGLSIFHADQVDFCENTLRLTRYKVASRAARDTELLKAIGETGKPVIMSCGLIHPDDIKRNLELLWRNDVTLLYCVCKYPAAIFDFNLSECSLLGQIFGRPYGLSSHCPLAAPTLAAVARGASVVENHVKPLSYIGCDEESSMGLTDYREMVEVIRHMELLR